MTSRLWKLLQPSAVRKLYFAAVELTYWSNQAKIYMEKNNDDLAWKFLRKIDNSMSRFNLEVMNGISLIRADIVKAILFGRLGDNESAIDRLSLAQDRIARKYGTTQDGKYWKAIVSEIAKSIFAKMTPDSIQSSVRGDSLMMSKKLICVMSPKWQRRHSI